MTYIAYDIEWDTDGEELDLPKEIKVDIPNGDLIKMPREEVFDFIGNRISEEVGFCHFSFSLTSI
jgi:hypothetical protein